MQIVSVAYTNESKNLRLSPEILFCSFRFTQTTHNEKYLNECHTAGRPWQHTDWLTRVVDGKSSKKAEFEADAISGFAAFFHDI